MSVEAGTTLIGRALLGSAALVVAWVLLIAMTAGIGLAIRGRLFSAPRLGAGTLIASFWLGMAATVLVLQLWQLLWPITPVAFVLLVLVSAAGFAGNMRALRTWVAELHRPTALIALGAVALAALWLGNRGLAQVATFDTYMYHVPVVEWYKQYQLVPGLGNLHERFAFNNAIFLYAALLERTLWEDGSTHLVNGIFVVAVLAWIAIRAAQLIRGREVRIPAIFDLVLLGPVLAVGSHAPMFSGLTPDLSAGLTMFAGFSMMMAAIWNVAGDSEERAFTLLAAAVSFTLATTTKLSVAGGALPAWIICTFLLWQSDRAKLVLRRRMLWTAVGFSVVLAGLWVARGVVASGYPFYPSTLAGLPVDWRIPAESGRASYSWIGFFARLHHDPSAYNAGDWAGYVCSPREWIGPWLRASLHPSYLWQVAVPLALTAVFGVLAATPRARGAHSFRVLLLLIPAVIAVVIWWVVAPRPIFGYWAFWLIAAGVAAAAAPTLPGSKWLLGSTIGGALVVMSMPLLGAGLDAARATDESNIAAAASVWFVRPDSGSLIQRTRWDFPLRSYVTRSGLKLYVPTGHRCARGPLPCTSHPSPSLELRVQGQLSSGFRADGPWLAERWPNPWTSFLANWRAPVKCGQTRRALQRGRSAPD